MPELGRFVKIRYSTEGPAGGAMRLLNEHIRSAGLKEGEAEARVLSFISPQNDGIYNCDGSSDLEARASKKLRLPKAKPHVSVG